MRSVRVRMTIGGAILALLVGNIVTTSILLSRSDGRPRATPSVLGERITAPSPSVIDEPVAPIVSTEPVTGVPSARPIVPPGDDTRPATQPRCRNSTDPSCGRFYWREPTSPDQRLEVRGFFSPNRPSVGEPVTFTATARDGDAGVRCCSILIGGESYGRDVERVCDGRYGPWDAPQRRSGEETFVYEHAFTEPGTYDVTFVASSGDHCRHPYGGTGTFTITLYVWPAD